MTEQSVSLPVQNAKGSAATWIGFAAMCLGMFMAVLDIQVVATSLPTIRDALGMQADQMSWIQTAYLIAEIIAIPLTGPLTRCFGIRRLFVLAVLAFTAASAGCASSSSFPTLVTWRALQGFSGGTLIPAVFSGVFLLFPERHQGTATTLAGIMAVLAPTLGPIVGGWITVTYAWNWLFLINIIPGLLAAAVGTVSLPTRADATGKWLGLDFLSLLLMAASLASLELALKDAPVDGWASPMVAGQFGLALGAGFGFAVRTWRRSLPLVDLHLFGERNFAIGCAFSFVLGIGLFGSVYLMPVFLGLVRHHSALEIGTIMLATGLAQLVSAPIAVALEQRHDARLLSLVGFGLFGLGVVLSAFQTPQTDAMEMLLPQILRGGSVMLCILAPTRLALGRLAPGHVPDASGLFNLMRNLGGAIGIALIDTVIFGRIAGHADHLIERLQAGDAHVARLIGIPEVFISAGMHGPIDEGTRALLAPALRAAALTLSINDAWALVGGATLAAIALIPFIKRSSTAVEASGVSQTAVDACRGP